MPQGHWTPSEWDAPIPAVCSRPSSSAPRHQTAGAPCPFSRHISARQPQTAFPGRRGESDFSLRDSLSNAGAGSEAGGGELHGPELPKESPSVQKVLSLHSLERQLLEIRGPVPCGLRGPQAPGGSHPSMLALTRAVWKAALVARPATGPELSRGPRTHGRSLFQEPQSRAPLPKRTGAKQPPERSCPQTPARPHHGRSATSLRVSRAGRRAETRCCSDPRPGAHTRLPDCAGPGGA